MSSSYNPEFQLSAIDRQKWQELKVPQDQWPQVATLMTEIPATNKPKKNLYEQLWRTYDSSAEDPSGNELNKVVEDLLCSDSWEDYQTFISQHPRAVEQLASIHACQGVEWVNYPFSPRIMADLWRRRAELEGADRDWDKVVEMAADQVAYRHTSITHLQFAVRQLVYVYNSARPNDPKKEDRVYRDLFVNTQQATDVCATLVEHDEMPPVGVFRWLWEKAGRPLLSHEQLSNLVCADLHVQDRNEHQYYLCPATFRVMDSDTGNVVPDYLNRAVTVTSVLGRDTVRECIESRWYSPPVREIPTPVPSPAPML